MTYYVRAPGTCGEFIQGSIDGQRFLVTCPINRFSYAMSSVTHPLRFSNLSLQPKALKAMKIVKALRGNKEDLSIFLRSDILQGKGMASSSADISVVAMATALATGTPLELKELEKIALSIEPSDAAFYPGIVQFDYIHGTVSTLLGTCPPLKVLIYDEGGIIDTLEFNKRKDLPQLISEKESLIEEALAIFKQGLRYHDISLIGQAATISAFGNQRILPKPSLYKFHEIGQFYNSVGTIIAHSGTIMGLLFPSDFQGIKECRHDIESHLPKLTFIDTIETTNEGITFQRR